MENVFIVNKASRTGKAEGVWNKIEEYLKSENIKFEKQKKFEWLGRQSLDFYLPEYNVAIECQGIQHFTDKTRFSHDTFKERIKSTSISLDNKLSRLYIYIRIAALLYIMRIRSEKTIS